jgi:hypothetical protein
LRIQASHARADNFNVPAKFLELALAFALLVVAIRFAVTRDWSIVLLCGLIAAIRFVGWRSE